MEVDYAMWPDQHVPFPAKVFHYLPFVKLVTV